MTDTDLFGESFPDDTLIDLVEELVAIPSVSGDRAACSRVLELVAERVGNGLHLTRIEEEGVQSLVVSTRPGRQAQIVLNAHLDVVPGHGGQFVPRRSNGRLVGRGAYDMKGAAAVYVRILQDIARSPPEQRPHVQVQFVTDEEVGGARGAQVLLREGFTGGVFIAGEPTNLDICHRAKGIVWVTVRVAGEAGHAAMPWLARNPVGPLLDGLGRVCLRWPQVADPGALWRTTASITGLRAGEAHNRIPPEAAADLDIRRVPEDSADEILAFIRDAFPGANIEVSQVGAALDTPSDDSWISWLSSLQNGLLGRAPRLCCAHYGSDARFYGAAGVSAFCWGPCGGGMHADEEWLDLSSLRAYDSVLRALLEI